MWVVKLGGSLDAAGRLGDSARAPQPLLVVPGVGPFADAVRAAQQRWRFDDRTAHVMAVLAMEQMAHVVRALAPALTGTEDVAAPWAQSGDCPVRVWHPRREVLEGGWPEADGIPSDWDVTADSLAAIVAAWVRAHGLVLVKSARLHPPAAWVEGLQLSSVLDAAFHDFGARCDCPIWLVAGSRPDLLFELLRGEEHAAVRVGFAPAAMARAGRRS
jgi:aspartokinase-like uncharacterized kinase